MPEQYVLWLEKKSVRLTPNGEIAVFDAIKALSEFDTPEEIWKKLQDENPEILSHCRRFHFSESESVLVADSQGWKRIETLLFDYILDQSLLS